MNKFAIVVPCFNEENTVKSVAEELCLTYENSIITIVDDGSTDKSRDNLKNLNFENLNLIESDKNYGKGHAMRAGLEFVKNKCDVVIFTDADHEVLVSDIKKVINMYEDPKVESVFGSRFLDIPYTTIKKMGFERYIANKLITFIANLRYKHSLSDSCTAVKSFKSELIDKLKLKSSGFDIEPEIIRGLSKNSVFIHEVPITYTPRSFKEGKKISFIDGIITIKELFK